MGGQWANLHRRRGRQFWRADWFVGAAVSAVLIMSAATDVFGVLERRFCDFASTNFPGYDAHPTTGEDGGFDKTAVIRNPGGGKDDAHT